MKQQSFFSPADHSNGALMIDRLHVQAGQCTTNTSSRFLYQFNLMVTHRFLLTRSSSAAQYGER